jgi:hypothetical protein
MDDPTLYDIKANKFRPTDPAALAAEIRRLHANDLTARDIAEALRLAPDHVINCLYGENLNAGVTSR